LEYAPQASGIYDRESIARNLGNLRKWLRDETASVRQIYEALIQDRHLHFWYEIENLCARKGKRIITIDPDVIDHERMTALYDRNKDVDTLKLAALVGGVTGMVCSVLLRRKLQEKPGQQSANELSEQEITTQDQPSTMPRREFLRKSLMATAGVSLGASVLSGLSEGASALNDAEYWGQKYGYKDQYVGREENPLGTFLYNAEDFRDVMVAKGLEHVPTVSQDDRPVGMIYGLGHKSGVGRYIRSPVERDMREKFYSPFKEAVGPHKLRMYEYDATKGEWRKIEERDIT